jgi:hypothetical protein
VQLKDVEELGDADDAVDEDDALLNDVDVGADDAVYADGANVATGHRQAYGALTNGTKGSTLHKEKVALAEKFEKSVDKKGKVYSVVVTLEVDGRRYMVRNFPIRMIGGQGKRGHGRVFELVKELDRMIWKKTEEKKITQSNLNDFVRVCNAGRSSFESAVLMMNLP